MKKRLVSILCGLIVFCSSSITTNARITDLLIKYRGMHYQYSYDEIMISAENNLLGLSSVFYDEYLERNFGLKAIKDDVKGYVDYITITEAAEDAVLSNEAFDLQQFISNVNVNSIILINFDIQQRILVDNYVKDGLYIKYNKDKFDVKRIY